jgi:Protein of unknown function (DUF3006)
MSDDSGQSGKSKKTRGRIDRVEDGGGAVVQLGDDASNLVDLPAELLPEGASDGDHLVITVRLERDARAAAEERIRALQERLSKRGKQD